MAEHIIVSWWRCNRFPWGCNVKHKTKEEAETCELQPSKLVYQPTKDSDDMNEKPTDSYLKNMFKS